jgi:hypothetical protein
VSTNDPKVESAVSRLEAMRPGAASFDAVLASTRAAISELEAPARAALFPLFANTTADAIAEFEFIIAGASKSTFDAVLLELHQEAVKQDARSMARTVRCRSVLSMVESFLLSSGHPAEAVASRISAFVIGIAGQLASAPNPPAEVGVLLSLPAFERRIATVVAMHQEHADKEREAEERARINRAEAARAARRAAVEDLRAWFSTKGSAVFMYRDVPMQGGNYVREVLAGDDAAAIPVWRVRHAIAARKTHEPNFQCPAWQREWTADEWSAYRNAIEDLRGRLGRVERPVFTFGATGRGPMTGSAFAQAVLQYEPDNQGVKPSSVRSAIKQLQRFDENYVWRGPSFVGFELDEEVEAGVEAFERVDRQREQLDQRERDAESARQWHKDYDERLNKAFVDSLKESR